MRTLRPYQQKAIDDITALYRSGEKKVCLHMATGGGKNEITSELLERVSKKGNKGFIVVHGRNLVNQASVRLKCDHGVLMANHKNIAPEKPIQVVSIDTLMSRQIFPDTEMIIIDEVHMAQSKSYKDLAEKYPNAYYLGVSATPFPKNTIEHVCTKVVKPVTHQELIDQGFLVPSIAYVPEPIKLSGVKVSRCTGDYDEHDLGEFMSQKGIIGRVGPIWNELSENRPTIAFAVTVAHSQKLVEEYRSHGITAAHLDAKTKDKDRQRLIEEHRNGLIKVLCNVGILNVGVDMPWVSCIAHCRPTLSLIWYLQACGRGTRPFEGKQNLIMLDHSSNCITHGAIETDREAKLTGQEKRRDKSGPQLKICPKCFAAIPPAYRTCPYCSSIQKAEEVKTPEHLDGKLILFKGKSKNYTDRIIEQYKNKLVFRAIENGYKRGWVFYKLKSRFGEEAAKKHLPWGGSQNLSKSDITRTFQTAL